MRSIAPATPLADILEKEWQAQVVQLARKLGWRVEAQLPRADGYQAPLSVPDEAALPEGLGDRQVGTDVCALEIAGEPTTKSRARVVRGGSQSYTPKRTREAEETIRWHLLQAGVVPDADHTVRVTVAFRSSTGQRRDLDNLVKLVLDACNGFAWNDDVQVLELSARVERRAPIAGISLTVTRIGRYTSDCKRCGKRLTQRRGSKPTTQAQYCSRGCYDQAQRPGYMVSCPECATPIYRQLSEESRLKFCSVACSQEYKRGLRRPYGDVGFPSLILVRDRVLFIELKAPKGKLTDDQKGWLRALRAAGAEAHVARPRDLEALAQVLHHGGSGRPLDAATRLELGEGPPIT